ncbi:type IV pilus assembly protein PilM [Candidatus Saccharibacteria bacterium]|nr:type IV pilus assembly protein PilM [Candidatus Saccharibacteria bacterium]
MNNTYFYQDKSVFGLDIGFSSLKVMQIDWIGNKQVVTGYGVTSFDPRAINDGVIVEPELIAKVMKELYDRNILGEITTKRVTASIPASRTYNRTLNLPKLNKKDLVEALRLEAEQYIPVPIDDLYIDFNMIQETDKESELLAVAAPKKIVDSYVDLAKMCGLEPIALETSIGAAGRLFVQAEQSDVPTILIDFGSVSSDITIYDDGLIVTGTVSGGGDNFTDLIAKKLKVTKQEAHIIKTKYGLGVSKKQKEITDALSPILEQLLKEIRRMIRYYEERSATKRKISQVVTMGGGANMPGLSEHMTNILRLPSRMCDPWQHLDFSKLQPPNTVEKSMYVTVAGLALLNPKEVFA